MRILVLLISLILTACAQRTPAVQTDDSAIVDCNVDRYNVRCPNPYGGAL